MRLPCHTGAIISGEENTAEAKMGILKSYGVVIVRSPTDIGRQVAEVLASNGKTIH